MVFQYTGYERRSNNKRRRYFEESREDEKDLQMSFIHRPRYVQDFNKVDNGSNKYNLNVNKIYQGPCKNYADFCRYFKRSRVDIQNSPKTVKDSLTTTLDRDRYVRDGYRIDKDQKKHIKDFHRDMKDSDKGDTFALPVDSHRDVKDASRIEKDHQ